MVDTDGIDGTGKSPPDTGRHDRKEPPGGIRIRLTTTFNPDASDPMQLAWG
jgi:hypothetical protein